MPHDPYAVEPVIGEPAPRIDLDTGHADIKIVRSTREMKVFTVNHNELASISSINAHATTYFSFASGFGFIVVDRIAEVIDGVSKMSGSIFIFALLAALFLLLGFRETADRRAIIRTIQEESSA